ncbi:MAG: hypothetical protein ACLPWS_05540 [Rhodomicrobium sp.]
MTAAIEDIRRAIVAQHIAQEGAALPILHALQVSQSNGPAEWQERYSALSERSRRIAQQKASE